MYVVLIERYGLAGTWEDLAARRESLEFADLREAQAAARHVKQPAYVQLYAVAPGQYPLALDFGDGAPHG